MPSLSPPPCWSLLLLLLGMPKTPAQQPASVQHPAPPPPPAFTVAQSPVAPVPPPAPPMTREQRRQLLDSVDPMLDFVSHDTGLPIRHRVKRRFISRDEIGRYLGKKLKDDDAAKRLERSELVLKKFGLLDRSFQLQPFLVTLLTEQIAGFYDNKTKTVNLLDWVAPAEQKPVLAHELTHALQDQTVDLERWGDSGVHGTSKDLADDRRHIAVDELETAREAVAEGQAMIVFFDDALRASGKTLADLSTDEPLISPDAEDDDGSSPVLARAPLLLRQSLLFPYTDGLSFERAVLTRRGRAGAFAEVLARPPSTSYEIMNPTAWLDHSVVPSITLPDLHPLLDPDYAPYDLGAMGELDVRILAETLGGKPAAEKLTPAWAGGVYYAAQRRSAQARSADQQLRSTTGSLALVYASRWQTEAAARSFAALYTLGLHHKYSGVTRRPQEEASVGEQIFSTTEGDAVILTQGRAVFIAEGLPRPLAEKVAALFAVPEGSGPQLQAAASRTFGEPSLALGRLLRSPAALSPPPLAIYTGP